MATTAESSRSLTVGALAPTPFRLAGGKERLDAGRALAVTDALGGGGGLLAEPVGIAEMRDVDGDEEVRAVVGYGEVAIERAHLRAEGALREQAAHQVDQEGQAEPFGPAGRQQHPGDRFRSDRLSGRLLRSPPRSAGLYRRPFRPCGSCPSLLRWWPCRARPECRRPQASAIASGLLPTTRSAPPGAGINGRVLHIAMPMHPACAACCAYRPAAPK